jgi:AcrR family transcriptional regulator
MDFAFKKFTTEGITQVTMDDIARGLGMGKGTLYKYFPSKDILMDKTVDLFASRIEKAINEVLTDEKLSPVDKLQLFLKAVAEKLSKINPAAIAYVERSMPELYEKITLTRERIILKNIAALFEEGKKGGIFDPEADVYLVAQVIIGSINHVLDGKVLSTLNYSFDTLFTAVISVILKGCLTKEGRKMAYPKDGPGL